MAIGRLIAKALLEGDDVHVEGFGTFVREAPPAAVHDHEQHRIWTPPRPVIDFRVENGPGDDAQVRGSHA